MNMQQKAYCSNYYDDGLSFGEGFILHVFFSAQELPDTVLFRQYGTRGCPNLEMSITEKHLSCVESLMKLHKVLI